MNATFKMSISVEEEVTPTSTLFAFDRQVTERPAHRGAFGSTGAAEGTRTPDPIITNDVLYQLSYSGTVAAS